MWYGIRRGTRSASAPTPAKPWASSNVTKQRQRPPRPARLSVQQRLIPGPTTLGRFRQPISHPSRDLKKIVAALDEVGHPITHFGKFLRVLRRNGGYPNSSQNHACRPFFLQEHRRAHACRSAHQRHLPVFHSRLHLREIVPERPLPDSLYCPT